MYDILTCHKCTCISAYFWYLVVLINDGDINVTNDDPDDKCQKRKATNYWDKITCNFVCKLLDWSLEQ